MYEEYQDMPCLAHLDANGKSTHTNRNYKFVNDLKADPKVGYKRARNNRPRGKGGKAEKESKESSDMEEDKPKLEAKADAEGKLKNPYVKKSGVFHTFLGTPMAKAKRSALRALNVTVPKVPQYVQLSEKPIRWDRSDHLELIPPGCYAMVVNPLIDGFEFTKCLMDGGSSLKIMYIETLKKMNFSET
jgi:hypothetical protein